MSPFTSRSAPTATSRPDDGEPLDVLVIGAGQAGLAVAWHLARRRIRYLVVDAASEIGHSWRARWDSLRLFTPSQYDGLPGMPFPAPADSYPTKDQVADYLRSYAETYAFPVLTGTAVARLQPTDDGFAAHTTQGLLRARQVVVATGAFHRPNVPPVADAFDPQLPQLHSATYRNRGQLPDGRILVVGGGNSGLQIAEELAATRSISVAEGSRPPSLPQRVAGSDLFWWLTKFGLIDRPADSPLARRIRARGDLVIGSSRRRLRSLGADFRPRLVAAEGRVARFSDGTEVELAAVVWATGFRPDYSWIDAPALGPDRQPVHRHGQSTMPGLWFVGLPWQRSRGSALLGFVQADAAFVTGRLQARALR